jgi:hypothetical protein
MKRYQVITYHHDCGADEKLSYANKKEAHKVAQHYHYNEDYEGALIYDLQEHKTIMVYGFIPLAAMPIEK